MAITTAITDLIKSFLELLESVLGSVYTIAHSFVAGIAHLFAGFFAMVGEVFGGVFDMVGGVGRFLAGVYFLPCFFSHLSWFLFPLVDHG